MLGRRGSLPTLLPADQHADITHTPTCFTPADNMLHRPLSCKHGQGCPLSHINDICLSFLNFTCTIFVPPILASRCTLVVDLQFICVKQECHLPTFLCCPAHNLPICTRSRLACLGTLLLRFHACKGCLMRTFSSVPCKSSPLFYVCIGLTTILHDQALLNIIIYRASRHQRLC